MNSFIVNMAQLTLCSGMFYLLFRAFLYRETFFRFNRAYLLFSLTFSVLVAFVKFPSRSDLPQKAINTIVLQTIQIVPQKIEAAQSRHLSLSQAIIAIYFLGLCLAVLFFIKRLSRLIRLVMQNRGVKKGNYTVYYLSEESSAFSFFRWIFMPASLADGAEAERILLHEMEHGRQMHSLDILFFEIYHIIFWFNPFVWLYKRALKDMHEYMADAAVVAQGCEKAEYKLLIFEHAIGYRVSMANSFNQSQIKKRLYMLSKKRSRSFAVLKFILAIPLVILFFFAFSCTKSKVEEVLAAPAKKTWTEKQVPLQVLKEEPKSETVEKKEEEKMDQPQDLQQETAPAVDTSMVYFVVGEMPLYPGGDDALRSYLKENIHYPEEAIKAGIHGTVYVQIVIDEYGKPTKAKVMRPVDPLLDYEAMRVVSNMPQWKPAKNADHLVRVYYVIPVSFQLD